MLRTALVVENLRVVRVLIGGEPLQTVLQEFEEEIKDLRTRTEPAGSRGSPTGRSPCHCAVRGRRDYGVKGGPQDPSRSDRGSDP